MPACISTSKRFTALSKLASVTANLGVACVLCFAALPAHSAFAQDKPTDRTTQPEEDDYSSTPFTEYGEFNEEAEEEADTRFFQHGRFFGVGFGLGFQGATGNRALAWRQGGFPLLDVKVHYWFDFNTALDIEFSTARHNFVSNVDGQIDITLVRLGVNLKYYFDTKDLSAPISFANPYVLFGVGSFAKTQLFTQTGVADNDSSMGISIGAGLEFPIKPKKIYFSIEPKLHLVSFKDTYTTKYQDDPPNGDALPNLSGAFYTFTANLMFTW